MAGGGGAISAATAKHAPAPVAAGALSQIIPGVDLVIVGAICFGIFGGMWFAAAGTMERSGWAKAREGLLANAMRSIMFLIIASALYQASVPVAGLINIEPGIGGAALMGGIVGFKGAGALDWALERLGISQKSERQFPDYTRPPSQDVPPDMQRLTDRFDEGEDK